MVVELDGVIPFRQPMINAQQHHYRTGPALAADVCSTGEMQIETARLTMVGGKIVLTLSADT